MIDHIGNEVLQELNVDMVIHYDPVVIGDVEINRMRICVEEIIKSIDGRLSLHDFRMVRGANHTNLIFDIGLPVDLNGKENLIGKTIDGALADRGDNMKYYTVITFDAEAFNRPIS